MASSAKHLSTHLYFHMERNHRKQSSRNSPAGTSGFHQSDLQHSPTSHRPRSWNKENDRIDMETSICTYNTDIMSSYETPLEGSPRHLTEHRGTIMGSDWPEDYFSYSPYLLTPDLSSKPRTRRRNNGRRYGASSSRYEVGIDDDEDYRQPIVEHPRLRPPEPASPILDRRVLPPTPDGSRDKDGPNDLMWPSLYPEEYEQDCFIVPSHMKARFLPIRNVSISKQVPTYFLFCNNFF